VTDHTSPLTQRVRRLLGASSLPPEVDSPHVTPNGHRRPDTGVLFENQITRLSHVLRELHAIDRAREAELRQLRERVAIAEAVAHAELVERLAPTIAQLDALIGDAARLLQPTAEPPPAATLFERMRVRATTVTDQARREALVAWASSLLDLRTQLASLLDE
jgi:hypothetical protein